jgi:IS605 OrfB family transposase
MLTYTTKLDLTEEDRFELIAVLESQRLAYNECSNVRFNSVSKNSIVDLHKAFYHTFRVCQPQIPSQIVISAEQECLSAYRSIKSNKHKINKPIQKKKLSLRLDARSFSFKKGQFSIISLNKRIKCKPVLYPKLEDLINKRKFCDPLVFEKNGEVWIALTFKFEHNVVQESSACGIDLGKRIAAVTSEGKFYQDKKFNKRKRNIRYLKRKLQSKGTKSAKKHLRCLRRKESNITKNQSHILANAILKDCKANVIVVEDLKGIKVKKHNKQNKNSISQVPFYKLRQILTYKAPFYGKLLLSVNPAYTSKIDHRTGKSDGSRQGRRYYGKDGVVLDADQNAAINIALRSKLPVSYITILDGQAIVNSPNVFKSTP